MKKLLIIAMVMVPTVVLAQTTPPIELTLKVTPDEINIISEGLQTQPFGKVLPLMNKLRQQVVDQQKPVTPPETEKPKQ